MESKNIEHISAVVVWFHPSQSDAMAIQAYNSAIDHVYVVDNSGIDNRSLLTDIANTTYIDLGQNRGIATALNEGIAQAVQNGADWVLTMDQDSRWNQYSVSEYIQVASQYEMLDRVGIFSPYQDIDGMVGRHHMRGSYEVRQVVMCSGNLLRTKAWEQVGKFREDFFIDLVDDEICCRLRAFGWDIVRINTIHLTHRLGEGLRYSPILRHPFFTHVPWRYFYIARNTRSLIKLYPKMAPYYRHELRKHVKHLLLYDWEDKCAKLVYFCRGLCSAKQG